MFGHIAVDVVYRGGPVSNLRSSSSVNLVYRRWCVGLIDVNLCVRCTVL